MATNTRKIASLLGASGAGIANDGTLTSAAIGDVIVSGDIADNAIDSEHYVDGSIDTAHVADDAITGAKIENSPTIAANLTVAGNLVVTGNSTINGTTTTINSTTLTIDDKMIELAHSPAGSEGDDAAIDGGGLTLKSSDSDNTILWTNATNSWNYNQGIIATSLATSDLILNNTNSMANEVDGTSGHWCVQEGDSDLFIINRVTNKKYKFKLEEIS